MRSKRAITNIITSVLLQAITIVCGFIIPKLIITKYGSNVNGLITSITQFLAFITLLEAGFGPVIKSILYKPIASKNKEEISSILKASERIFKKIAYIFIAYVVILSIILPLRFAQEFDYIYTISLVVIIAASTFAEYYFGMTYSLFLYADQKNYVNTIIKIATLILNTIVVLILIYLKQSIQVVKLATAIIFIMRPIIQIIYVKKKYKINLKNADNTYKIKQKWDGLAQHVAYVIHSNADVAILTIYGNLLLISVYSIYKMIVNSVKNVVQSFTKGIDAAFGDIIAKGEQDTLNTNFKSYEALYYTIATIAFSATLFLIIPFISVYMSGVTDADYINTFFAWIMVLAFFINTIRQPYHDLVKVAGHFKQTQVGAWIEAISNIVISIVLVWKFQLVGIAIGTLVAMIIRTMELMYYTAKHILKRKVFISYRNFIVAICEIIAIAVIVKIMPEINVNNYIDWILNAINVGIICCIVVIPTNVLLYKDSLKNIIRKVKKA